MEAIDANNEFQSKLLELMERQNRTMNTHTELLERLIKQNQNQISRSQLVSNGNATINVEDETNHQKESMERMVKALESMEQKLGTLEKNSNIDHDDKPFAQHELETHEPAWRGVYETLSTVMKDKVERWKSGMDSSLIFVGLFVTIITAFLAPVLQNLAPNPSDLTNNILTNLTTVIYEVAVLNGLNVPTSLAQPEPFQPSRSDEILSLLWYSALLLSLITAFFSVLGRRWVDYLTSKPECQRYMEKSCRLDFRDKLANRLLKPILNSLHPILILSITLFIVGLLFQLWTITLAANKSTTLLLTSKIGSGLIALVTLVALGTVLRGVYSDESPFTTSTSAIIRWFIPSSFLQVFKPRRDLDLLTVFCTANIHMDNHDNYDNASSARLFRVLCHSDSQHLRLGTASRRAVHTVYIYKDPQYLKSRAIAHAIDSVVHFLGSDASQKAKLTMSWNLLDVDELGGNGYKKLGSVLSSLEEDTPSRQKKIKLGFLYVRMVLCLRANHNRHVSEYGIVDWISLEDSNKTKKVLLEILKLYVPRRQVWKGKGDVARIFAIYAKEDPRFLHGIRDDLLNAILDEKIDDALEDGWRETLLPVLPENDVTEIFHRISIAHVSECSKLYLEILASIIIAHDEELESLRFPDDFDLSKLMTSLKTNEARLSEIVRFKMSPAAILLIYSYLMNDTLLSRQQSLRHFLKTVIDETKQDFEEQDSVHDYLHVPFILEGERRKRETYDLAVSLLERITRLTDLGENDPSASDEKGSSKARNPDDNQKNTEDSTILSTTGLSNDSY